jgi:hypothetical protein
MSTLAGVTETHLKEYIGGGGLTEKFPFSFIHQNPLLFPTKYKHLPLRCDTVLPGTSANNTMNQLPSVLTKLFTAFSSRMLVPHSPTSCKQSHAFNMHAQSCSSEVFADEITPAVLA